MDRHTYAYRGFYVDTWRGIDVLLSRPEVDATRIGVTGQQPGRRPDHHAPPPCGPRSAPRPPACPTSVAYLDAIELTHTYPYEEINDYLRLHPEVGPAVEETLAYFDGINFADRITCPIIVNIGLQDNVCPPETGYALFDRIGAADKRLYPYDGHGHDAGRSQHGAIVDRVLRASISCRREVNERMDETPRTFDRVLAGDARRAGAAFPPAPSSSAAAAEHRVRHACTVSASPASAPTACSGI